MKNIRHFFCGKADYYVRYGRMSKHVAEKCTFSHKSNFGIGWMSKQMHICVKGLCTSASLLFSAVERNIHSIALSENIEQVSFISRTSS